MPHENSLGVVTGLVLLASVLAMISSLEQMSRALRPPPSSSGQVMSLASYDELTIPAQAALSCLSARRPLTGATGTPPVP
jgi:hypothetical protein